MARTEELVLSDFTGGLNLRAGEFYLAEGESPDMVNVFLDRRGGFRQRRGTSRWNDATDIGLVADWDPRNMHVTNDAALGADIFVANNDTIYHATYAVGTFSDLSITSTADPHLADFAAWGDVTYIASGRANQSHSFDGSKTALTDPTATAGAGFNDDETAPVGGYMPKAELVEEHNGRLFVGNIAEDGVDMPNRIRWSHPLEPEDWRTDDYWDIDVGGGRITALVSQNDRLLIFKTTSVYALYGSELDNFELQLVSSSLSCPHAAAVDSTESSVVFFSRQGSRSAVFSMSPDSVDLLSQPIELALDEIQNTDYVFVDYVDRFLQVSVPWTPESRGSSNDASLFVHNSEVGQGGSWTRQVPAEGSFRMSVEPAGGDVLALVTDVDSETPIVAVSALDGAVDILDGIGTQQRFVSSYSTGWIDAGWPTRKKHWLRPKYLVREPEAGATEFQLDVYWNFKSSAIRRSFLIGVSQAGELFWKAGGSGDPGGFDWGDGAEWASAGDGHELGRVITSLGVAESVRLVFSSPVNGTLVGRWLIDAIFMKYAYRRLTT